MEYGIVGNCAFSALIDHGSIEWLCFPRMDSDFIFGGLLDKEKGGYFSIESEDSCDVSMKYIDNTNVLETRFTTPRGSFSIIDFAPRFEQYERYFKPTMLVRIIRLIEGEPLIRIRCQPVGSRGEKKLSKYSASNHIAFGGASAPLRLTTNAPLTSILEERIFLLRHDLHLVLSFGHPLEEELEETAEKFLRKTVTYWRKWVKHTRVPRDYQEEVIRSALVLKLHQFEDTGALLAATTTSIPEFPGSGRNWDYRFCWLRDAYFTLNALERIGHFEEMELFITYLRTICELYGDSLRPVYTLVGGTDMEEVIIEGLAGYKGDGPVRYGNQAHEHIQNDVYGEMILAVSRLLLDARFVDERSKESTLGLVRRLLAQIEITLEEPDAGLWELRERWQLHSFSLLMHWAGARRAKEIGAAHRDEVLMRRGASLEARARQLLLERAWDHELGAITQAVDQKNLDAAMLLAVQLGFFADDPKRAQSHIHAIRRGLSLENGLLRRYDVADDFGYQRAAFTVCSFWLAEALALSGEIDEGKELMERLLSYKNSLGLYSEDILPATGQLSGNFPQTYSHVGLINAAFRLSRAWD